MNILFAAIIAAATFVWGLAAGGAVAPPGVHPWWWLRQEAILLSGLLSIAMMSLAMLLSTRPAWLETPLGGMDRVYRAHKWAGLLAGLFAILHWLGDQAGGPIKSAIGKAGRLPKEEYAGLLGKLQHLTKDMGEWAFYAIIIMLLLALWKKFPYRPWRLLHRAMPAIYLILAAHAALLSPFAYWRQPAGWLLALLLAVGVWAALCSLRASIGRGRRADGEIVAIELHPPALTTVSCRLRGWRGHRPGQFAFVTFDEREGAHPFSIASADRGDGCLSFQIKALGDYTRLLPQRLRPGQRLRVEGPYGRFDLNRLDRRARQIWVAGGVGVTPFLAWLEALQAEPDPALAADLHYCTRARDGDPFAARLEALCAGLPGIRLSVHDDGRGERLDAGALLLDADQARRAEIWFCGPNGLAAALKNGLRHRSEIIRFHQEAFEMR